MPPREEQERSVDVGHRYPGGVVTVRTHWERGSWWGQVVEVPGAIVSGADEAELDDAVREALDLLSTDEG